MHFLLICKFKKDQINSNREKVETLIFRHSRTANTGSVVESGRKGSHPSVNGCPSYCKNEDSFKNEGTRVVTTFPPL